MGSLGSHHATPRHATPCHAMPHPTMPCHTMLCQTMPHHTPTMPRHATPHHAMPCHTHPPCHTTPCHMPHHAMPRHTTPHHATPCHAPPCHAMPHHATPRHATPCHATPCHAAPRHTMPCHATPRGLLQKRAGGPQGCRPLRVEVRPDRNTEAVWAFIRALLEEGWGWNLQWEWLGREGSKERQCVRTALRCWPGKGGLEKDVSGGGEVGRPRRVVCVGGQDCSERGQDTGGSYGSWIFRQMKESGTRCDDVGVAMGG